MDGPFFQTQTQRSKACQVDYLIQTRTNNLYLGEIKLSKNPIKNNVIEEVLEKMNRLRIPSGYSVRPVLIHANGIDNSIIESDFFVKAIDFGELLK